MPVGGVRGRREDALVAPRRGPGIGAYRHLPTDVFPTVAATADVDLADALDAAGDPVTLDGTSLLPHLEDSDAPSAREFLFSESFEPNGPGPYAWHDRTVRDTQWKLVPKEDNGLVEEELFRLEPGAWDDGEDPVPAGLDPEAQAALDRLREVMEGFVALGP